MLLAFVVGVIVSAVVAYLTNKSFRTKVQTDLGVVSTELAALKVKATNAEGVVTVDFTKAEAALKALFAKL